MTTFGPITKTVSGPTWRKTSQVYRQKPITSTPLPYSLDLIMDVYRSDWKSWASNAIDLSMPIWQRTSNTARERFVSEAKNFCYSPDSQLGVGLAEWRQSHNMIAARSSQLLGAVNQLRKGNVAGAARSLGLGKKQAPRKHAGDLAGLFLEMRYGWIPLLQDIHNAVGVLQSPFQLGDSRRAVGSATGTYIVNTSEQYWLTYQCACRVSADVRITNPNLFLANKLGLVNPATVAWELVPFSFVIDWFIPVGAFFAQYNELLGISLTNAQTTYYGIHLSEMRPWYWNNYSSWMKKRVQVQRGLSIPTVKLVPNLSGLSPGRGANAIALLTQALSNLKG